jgi:malonyl CoA-acyl carrier protein transacylase
MARGRDLRAQAAEIIAVINDRQEKTARLLAELQEHEGIHFVPEPEVDPSGAIIPGRYAVSGTAKLCMDADARLRQAETTEQQIVRVEPDAPTTGRKSGAVSIQG